MSKRLDPTRLARTYWEDTRREDWPTDESVIRAYLAGWAARQDDIVARVFGATVIPDYRPAPKPKKRPVRTLEEPWGPGEDGDKVTPAGLAYIWNAVAGKRKCPKVTGFAEVRKRKSAAALRDEPDPYVWGAAFAAICEDEFLSGKDGGKVYATFDYAMSSKRERWLDEARNLVRNEEVIP